MLDIIHNNSPEQELVKRISGLPDIAGAQDSFAVVYEFEQYYLTPRSPIRLLAIYELYRQQSGAVKVVAGVTQKVSEAIDLLRNNTAAPADLAELLEFVFMDISAPVTLQPVSINKPWGREVWYTGMEDRGHSCVTDGRHSTPLAWWLSVASESLQGPRQQSINLLKILDPLPDEVYGDLYFELHEKKQEVYVVTHVDSQAWPEGKGGIRFGFNQKLRAACASDDDFKNRYLKAVFDYEQVRREIDRIFDEFRQKNGIAVDEPLDANVLKAWHKKLPKPLISKELELRGGMNSFTDIRQLTVGDVVKVPCYTPHALQHGVRTIEFQTPVYERKILSFAQKVLTQNHWDTNEAATMMNLDAPADATLATVESSPSHKLENIVNFDDFRVFRLTLESGAEWKIPESGQYGLLMGVQGVTECANGHVQKQEQASLLPACRNALQIINHSEQTAILLFAEPCHN